MEKYYIRLYGRKDLGTGILRNRTDGGEGWTGGTHSPETRQKLAITGRIGGLKNVENGHCKRIAKKGGDTARDSGQLDEARRICMARGISKQLGKRLVASGAAARGNKQANHLRWHVRRNKTSPKCELCVS